MVGFTLLKAASDLTAEKTAGDKAQLVDGDDYSAIDIVSTKDVGDTNEVLRAQRRKKHVCMLLASVASMVLIAALAVGIWLLVSYVTRSPTTTWRRTCKYRLKPFRLDSDETRKGQPLLFDHGGLTAFDDGRNSLLPGPGRDQNKKTEEQGDIGSSALRSNVQQSQQQTEFQQEVKVDLSQNVATIDVPQIGFSNTIRIIEDFELNLTAIRDMVVNKCFIMPLDRDHVPEPKSFIDVFAGMMNGQYLPDQDVLRKTMKVQMPPLTSSEVQQLGVMVLNSCADVPSFRLVPKTEDEMKAAVRRRRSPGESSGEQRALTYVYSVGKRAIAYTVDQ